MEQKDVIYMVTYSDDNYQQHMTFVKGYSSVRYLEDRFDRVKVEPTETYNRENKEDDFFHY